MDPLRKLLSQIKAIRALKRSLTHMLTGKSARNAIG